MILFSFGHFGKKNPSSTTILGTGERREVGEKREFGWLHDLVRKISYFYSIQSKSPQKNASA